MLRAAHSISKTDTGRQRRDNEDSSFARAPLFVVADGMGGAQAGEVASKIAVEAFQGELPEGGSPEERLAGAAQVANRQIYDVSRTDHERAGMGTTLTAVYVDENDIAVAHVGDSRAYLFRDGELGRLTQDHTLVEELLKRGKLTEEQAAEHPQRSIITRALGVDPEVEVDTWTYAAHAGDVVLLCSDGLTSMISEQQITTVLTEEADLGQAAERLIADANEAGGRDNITVILFSLEDVGDDARGDEPTMVGMAPPPAPDGDENADPAAQTNHAAADAQAASATITEAPTYPPPDLAPRARLRPRLARTQGRKSRDDLPPRGARRFAKPVAALLATVIVVFLVGAGGYLATRQLFFIGTNNQGIVTIFRGLPYDLPFGIRLYETFYVSGVPVKYVPAQRRSQLINHQIRSQGDAINLVHAAELGQLAK